MKSLCAQMINVSFSICPIFPEKINRENILIQDTVHIIKKKKTVIYVTPRKHRPFF